MTIEAKTVTRTTHAVQLTLDQADAQHLMTLLHEMTRFDQDNMYLLHKAGYENHIIRAIKDTASELVKVLAQEYIIPATSKLAR